MKKYFQLDLRLILVFMLFSAYCLAQSPNAVCKSTTIYLSSNGMYTLLPAEVDDGSVFPGGTLSVNPNMFACAQAGQHVSVTLTATDSTGASSNCTTLVMVLDTIPPVAKCKNFNLFLNGDGFAVLSPENVDDQSSDACGTSFSLNKVNFNCNDVGNREVVLIVTDPSGNSSSCTAIVTVIDNTAPVASCKPSFILPLDLNGNATLQPSNINQQSSDACGIGGFSLSRSNFNCDDAGQNRTVTLFVTDQNNNTSSCTSVVSVKLGSEPVAICRNITISLNSAGSATVEASQINNGSSDICGGPLSFSLSKTLFTCDDIGTNIVTLTVTNQEGLSATCTATVTVTPPSLSFATNTKTKFSLCGANFTFQLVSSDNINPSSIVFSGPGIIGSSAVFDPSGAGVGMHTIEATALVNGCPVSTSITVEVTPLDLDILPYCVCNNDSEENESNGTYRSTLRIKGEEALPIDKVFRVFLSNGLFNENGNVLSPNTPFFFCNGNDCPFGVENGQYYLQVWIENDSSGNSIEVVETCSNTILSKTDFSCSGYPTVPEMPGIFNDSIVCTQNNLNVPRNGGYYSLNEDPKAEVELPPGFIQNNIFNNFMLIQKDSVPNFPITLYLHKRNITSLDGFVDTCYTTSSRELTFLRNPNLNSEIFACFDTTGGSPIYLSNLLESFTEVVGKFTIDGNLMEDGEFIPSASGCYAVSYDPEVCDFSPLTSNVLVTIAPDPRFNFSSVSPSPVCSPGDSIQVSIQRLSTGFSPKIIITPSDPGAQARVIGNISSGNVTLVLPAPNSAGGITYRICLEESGFTPPDNCGSLSTSELDPCLRQRCISFTVYNDGFGCGSDALFANQCELVPPSDLCPSNTKPTLDFSCRYLTIRGPRIITSSVRGGSAAYNCKDEEIEAIYSLNLPGILGNAVSSGPRLNTLPGMNVICAILNFRLKVSFRIFRRRINLINWKPFGSLGDGCNRTIGQAILDALSTLLGGDGGGGFIAGDSRGLGNFDVVKDIEFGISNESFMIPNRISGAGHISFRVAGGWPFKASALCGAVVTQDILLLDLLPIGAIPIVGAMAEDILAAAGCNIDLTFSSVSDVQIPVFDNSPPQFFNCFQDGYTFYTTTGCETPVDWAIPSAFEDCRGEVLSYKGFVQSGLGISEAGIYQVEGVQPGSILSPGVYPITYRAVGCSGNSTLCSFNVVVSIEPPILSTPPNLTFNNDVNTCTRSVNGLAPTQGLGCLTTLNYKYTNPVSNTVVETNDTAPGVHNIPDGHVFEKGTTIIEYTLSSDNNGNGIIEPDEIQTKSFSITILDAERPLAQCIDVEVTLNNLGTATVFARQNGNNVFIDGGCIDNCDPNPLRLISRDGTNFSPSVSFTCDDIGDNFVTLRVWDESGNFSDCRARVRVNSFFEPLQLNLNIPPICLGPFQDTFDLTNYVTIDLPGGNSISHHELSSLGSLVFGEFFIMSFLPDNGSAYDPGEIDENGVLRPGNSKGFLRIGYAVAIEGETQQTPIGVEGCFKLTSQVVRIETFNPEWEAGSLCCDALPVWLGGATDIIPSGFISLESIGGTYPIEKKGRWTGEGVVFSDPDGLPFSGDEFFYFDPSGLDGNYSLTYRLSGEACSQSHVSSMRVTCQPLMVDVSSFTVCPNTTVDEIEILTNLSDQNLRVTTDGMAEVGGVDLFQQPVQNGRVVIPSFVSVIRADESFPIRVYIEQSNNFGCSDEIEFEITVRDTEAPIFINCSQGQIFTISLFPSICEGSTIWSIPVPVDNCGIESFEQTAGPSQDSSLSVGIYEITYTAIDFVGNSSTCTFFINVIDTELPVITCPANVVTASTDLGVCDWASPEGSLSPLLQFSNCPSEVTWEVLQPNGEVFTGFDDVSQFVFPLGTSAVKYVITETANQQSWECSFTVTVVDEEPPILTCPQDLTLECGSATLEADIMAWIETATATDNCDDEIEIITTLFSMDSQCGNSSTRLYRFVATDAALNSSECFAFVVIEDTTPPLIAGGEDITVECILGGAGNDDVLLSWLNNNGFATATDNCGSVTWSNNFNSANWISGCENTRFVDVVFTAADPCGNSSSITLRFAIEDTTPPVFINCPRPDIVVKSAPDLCSNFVNFSLPIAVDDCDIAPQLFKIDDTGLTSGDMFPVGKTTLIWEAIDCSGNSTICEINIFVNDHNMPEISCPEDLTLLSDPGICGASLPDMDVQTADICKDNTSLIYSVEYPAGSGDVFHTGVGSASGIVLPVGTSLITYVLSDQPIVKITEVTHRLEAVNGGTAPVPGFIDAQSGDDFLEITNFGPAAIDLGCLSIERIGVLNDPANESFMVPNGTVLEAGEVLVVHFGPGLDDLENRYFNIPDALDLEIGVAASYVISLKGRVIDVVSINGHDPIGLGTLAVVRAEDWNGSLPVLTNEGGIYRKRIFDTNSSTDWGISDVCVLSTIGSYNPVLPIVESNGTATSLQAQNPNVVSCSITIDVEDNELPQCGLLHLNAYSGQSVTAPAGFLAESKIIVDSNFEVGRIVIRDIVATGIPVSEMVFKLKSPAGTTAVLYDGSCQNGSSVNFGFSEASELEFNMQGCSMITGGQLYLPLQSLLIFNGELSEGEWSLLVGHKGNSGTIALSNWSLDLYERLPYGQGDEILPNDPGLCTAVFTWDHPCGFDNCDFVEIIVTYTHEDNPSVSEHLGDACVPNTKIFQLGTTMVEYMLTDINGNVNFCGFNVTVIDVEAPVISCPEDLIIELEPGQCNITRSFTPEVDENCGGVSLEIIPGANYTYDIGVHEIIIIATDGAGLSDTCSFIFTVLEFGSVTNDWACFSQINVSLGSECNKEITPEMILTGGPYGCFDNYVVVVGEGTPMDFTPISTSPFVTLTELDQLLVAKVTDPETENTCWGYVLVENKRDPEILCPSDVRVACNADTDPESLGEVELLSCVPNAIIRFDDEVFEFNECDTIRTRILRTWTVTDVSGRSSSCVQTIEIETFNLLDVVYPSNFDGIANPVFDCVDVEQNPSLIHPSNTGLPVIRNKPVVAAHLCESSLSYTDERFDICGSSYQILRTWKVFNICLPVSHENPRSHTQIIRVLDRKSPVWSCVDSITIPTNSLTCDAFYNAEGNIPDVIASCSGIADIQVIKPKANNRYEVGTHQIRYIATDSCGNRSTCIVNLTVEDDVLPTAICETFRVASLGSDCTVRIPATAFDDGSYDNCGIVSMKVARMRPSVCYNIPTYGNNSAAALTFRDSVEFCCDDLTADEEDRMVIFRITDEAGNTNECMVIVEVQDKLHPIVNCPPDITVDCQLEFDTDEETLNTLFGRIVLDPNERRAASSAPFGVQVAAGASFLDGFATDNCLNTSQGCGIDIQVVIDAATDCSQGVIARIFTVTDAAGNTARCTQLIHLENTQPFDAAFFRVYRQIPGVNSYPLFPEGPYEEQTPFLPGVTGQARLNLRPANTPFPTRFDIVWPADLEVDFCGQALDPETLKDDPAFIIGAHPYIERESICSSVGTAFEDWEFEFDGGCKKIVRRWKVIDWCQEETVLNPWTWEQTIKVTDTEDPVITGSDYEFCITDEVCSPEPIFDIIAFASDNCTEGDQLVWDWEVIPFGDLNQLVRRTSFPGQNANNGPRGDSIVVSRRWPLTPDDGPAHIIRFFVNDGCGNSTTEEFEFRIRDCKKPTPICFNGLAAELMPTTSMVEVDAVLLNAGSYDNCTAQEDLVFRIERTADSDGETPPLSTSLVFDCDDLGMVEVNMWVGDQWGNWDFCETYIIIQNNMGADCDEDGFDADITGRLSLETGDGIEDAIVHIGLGDNFFWQYAMSDSDGSFSQEAVSGLTYTIRPERNDNPRNGVTTLDILLIQRHILGVSALDSPYKRIAADANNSGHISAIDLVDIRSVILGRQDGFTDNTSWRFIDSEYEFEADQPEGEDFPESRFIDALSEDGSHDEFIGVKIGDVNYSAAPNSAFRPIEVRSAKTLEFVTDDITLIPGREYRIEFTASNFENIYGYQYTMIYRTDLIDFAGVDSEGALGLDESYYGLTMLERGMLTSSWNDDGAVSISDDEVVFTLKFRAKTLGRLSEAIFINSEFARAEAYGPNDEEMNVELRFARDTDQSEYTYELFQNIPNPWQDETLIGFTLPEEMSAELTIFDISGKTVDLIRGDFKKGYNEVRVRGIDIPQKGILFYRLDTDDFSATKKMILIE